MENKYIMWFNEIIKLMVSMLNNKFIFEKKIELLSLKTFITTESTNGLLLSKDEKYDIAMSINPKDDEAYIRFVFGHELAHLLFRPINKLKLSGYSATDESFGYTYIQRKSESGRIYGMYLEELICDYIALELTYRSYDKYSRNELKEMVYSIPKQENYFTKENLKLTEQFVSLFGEELKDLDKIDSYPKGDIVAPDNIFLYTISTGDLSLLVNDYDQCMGNGAWKRLNICFDNFFIDNSKVDDKEFIETEFKRFKMLKE